MPSNILKRKRKDGSFSYQVRIPVGKKPDGKPNYIVQTFDKEADAKKLKNKILRERDQGTAVVPEKITFDEYLDRWMAASKKGSVKANTFASYEFMLGQYVRPYLGSRRLDQISPLEVQQLMTQLAEKDIGPRTIRYAYGLIKDALGQAVRWGMIARNVAENVDPPRQVRKEMQALDEEQVGEFLKVITGAKHEILFRFMLYTGVRPSEAPARMPSPACTPRGCRMGRLGSVPRSSTTKAGRTEYASSSRSR